MIKKFAAIILAFAILFSMSIQVFAINNDAEPEPKSIKKPISYITVCK